LKVESRIAEEQYQKYTQELATEAELSKWEELAPHLGGYFANQLVNEWRQDGYKDWDWKEEIAESMDERKETMQTKIAELTPRLGEEKLLSWSKSGRQIF
jgi:hypothetical protein